MKRVILVGFMLASSNSFAYTFLKHATQLEYMASSPMCQTAISVWNANRGYPLQFVPRIQKQEQDNSDLIWSTGGWHYCGGAIRIRRGQASLDARERQDYLEDGIQNALYSFNRIQKSEAWAAEMGTTIARAYSSLGARDKAFEYLDLVLRNHPNYRSAYLAYGLIYYDEKDYDSAEEYFEKANNVSGKPSAQATYFLGLVAVKKNDLEQAKKYSAEAKRLGYPLPGLERQIAREEAASKK